MSDLFMHVYLDEDVHGVVADRLRARGFQATTARGVGNVSVPDATHLAYATRQGMAVVTHTRDDYERLA